MSRRCSLLLAALALVGCGPQAVELLDNGPRQPRLIQQGACAPSTAGTELTVETRASACVRRLSGLTLAEDEAAFASLFEAGCEVPVVDFTQRRALVLSSSNARGSLFAHFLHARADALEVGVLDQPVGSLIPTTIMLLPLAPGPLELRWCNTVCVQNCDVAIP